MIRPQTLLTAALVSLAVTGRAAAQEFPTDRGSFIVSGGAGAYTATISYGDDDTEDPNNGYSVVSLSPQVQYFVTPGLAVGGRVSASVLWSGGDSHSQFGIGPQLSYFFGRGERPFYPYVSAGVSYDGLGEDHTSFGQNAQAGLVFMLSRGVGLNSAVYYQNVGVEEVRQQVFGLQLGVTAFVF
ncbi:MAG: hypothetical protein ICV87_01300 [Gemmatimonadetes bacterium]|nr:hypothetical protein [Gemmatimonadota bacterium]